MMIALSLKESKLLKEILVKNAPSLLPVLDSVGLIPLTGEQREEIREAIADELLKTGLSENDEPNERGLLLESLIDRLGHL